MARAGRRFLHIPAPTNAPDSTPRAMDDPAIDRRGAAGAALKRRAVEGVKRLLRTEARHVVIHPGSRTGAREAALVNAPSPGDAVLMVQTGRFANPSRRIAERPGLARWSEETRPCSRSLTAAHTPRSGSADALRGAMSGSFALSLGAGRPKRADRVCRVGHLGDFTDPMLMRTPSGGEMGLALAGVPHKKGGAAASMAHLVETAPSKGGHKAAA